MVRRAVENREEEILKAAIKIFSEKGYSAATTSEIAKEAGVAEGTIFRYFKNKKELLHKMILCSLKTISDSLIKERIQKIIEDNRDSGAETILKAIILDRIELIEKNIDIFKVVLTEIQYHEDLREQIVENFVYVGKNILSNFIEAQIVRDEFREVDVVIAVRSLIGMIAMYFIQSSFFPNFVKLDREAQVEEMVNIFLYGVKKGVKSNGK